LYWPLHLFEVIVPPLRTRDLPQTAMPMSCVNEKYRAYRACGGMQFHVPCRRRCDRCHYSTACSNSACILTSAARKCVLASTRCDAFRYCADVNVNRLNAEIAQTPGDHLIQDLARCMFESWQQNSLHDQPSFDQIFISPLPGSGVVHGQRDKAAFWSHHDLVAPDTAMRQVLCASHSRPPVRFADSDK